MSKMILYLCPVVGRGSLRYLLAAALSAASSPTIAQTVSASVLATGHILPPQAWFVASGALVGALTLGYAAGGAIGERGFAARSSGLLAMIGCWSAFAVYAWRFLHGGADGPLGFLIVAIFGALALALGVAGRAFALGVPEGLGLGRHKKVSAAYERVLEPPPKGPSEERMRAAVNRANR